MSKKCRDLEIGVRVHSRSSKVVSVDRVFLVTLFLKRTAFEIFDFKSAVTSKTGLGVRQGHLKYHTSIERIYYNFLLTFYINYDSISCRF